LIHGRRIIARGHPQTPEYQAAKAQLADREWRLDNLYWIKNKEGVAIPFKRNRAQRQYSARSGSATRS
jgi:hypothetical protein